MLGLSCLVLAFLTGCQESGKSINNLVMEGHLKTARLTDIGSLRSEEAGRNGFVFVSVVEFSDTRNSRPLYALRLAVIGGRPTTNDSTYVPYSEIDDLLTGLERLSKIRPSSQTGGFASFESHYATSGGLDISVYGSVDQSDWSISTDKIGTYGPEFIFPRELVQFQELIGSAKAKLDSIRGH